MAKDVFCKTCDKFFQMTRTDFCPLCGMTLRRGDGSLVTRPKENQPDSSGAKSNTRHGTSY